jgi:primosomal protein N' (replication factor Y) (superfamily II helicase)
VSGERAARSDASVPDVVVETRDPEHHALRALVAWDAGAFWEEESALRAPLGLPPLRRAIRIEGDHSPETIRNVRSHVAPGDGVIGPLPLEGDRMALLVLSEDRSTTLAALRPLREEQSRRAGDLRLDVDPVDLG